jgi:hypothetical protein
MPGMGNKKAAPNGGDVTHDERWGDELPSPIPDRKFIDDLGRQWEWCGGTEDTWAWRVTT